MSLQMALFGSGERVFVDDETGRIAYHPTLFEAYESRRLFERLKAALAWEQETMWMYDHSVAVPRLIARFLPGSELPEELLGAQRRLESFLKTSFNALSVQYYRSGSDSVAWHSDHTEDLIDLPVVAVISLGATREMQVRSKSRPGRSFRCDLEAGSLFVMSGRAQEFWEHHIPKSSKPTEPRMSIALRQRRAGAESA